MSSPGVIVLIVAAIWWGASGPDYLVYTVNAAIPTALAGLGLLVLVGWGREISLVTAGLLASSLYCFGWLNRTHGGLGLGFVPAGLLIIIGAGASMAVLALLSSRLPGIYLVMLTLGVQVLTEKTVYPTGWLSGGFGGSDADGNEIINQRPNVTGLDVSKPFHFLGHSVSGDGAFYFFSLALFAVVLVLLVRFRHSPYGLAFLLVGSDRQAAGAIGVPALRMRAWIFALYGALTGCGGIIACWLYVDPPVYLTYEAPYSLVLLAIPVLAGLDSIGFVVVTAVAFQTAPVALEKYRIGAYLLAGIALLAGAAFGSRGIGGRMHDFVQRLKHGPRRQRTARVRVDTAVLRASDGTGGTPTELSADRARAVRVLEAWLPPRPGDGVALSATGVDVQIGGLVILKDAAVTVPNGSMVGLVGPNGAGKSTMFDVICGIRRPDRGRITLFGHDVTDREVWDRSGYGMARTFQTTRVVKDLSVRENLIAGAYQKIRKNPFVYLAGVPSAWAQVSAAEEAAWAAAVLLDIDRYWDERCSTLEFSARRRVEIGRALLSGPRLLLMDEPAAGLDPNSTLALFDLVRRLRSDLGLTVLLVEHYVKAVLSTCDLVVVLAEGQVLAVGTPAEIAADPEVQARYLGARVHYQPKQTPQEPPCTERPASSAPHSA
jgi:ABC-type branched-subunit amino acid transport system ATPase component/ABC-type branched-subunit amino acid transport system permease subunit